MLDEVKFDPYKIIDSLDEEGRVRMASMADTLIDNASSNPAYVQELITTSKYPGALGQVAYMLLCLYATGKIVWSSGDPWMGKPGGWISKEESVGKKDLSIN